MLIKIIRCTPKQGQREAFSKSQESWHSLSTCPGFLGQFGGWDAITGDAFIFAFWSDPHALEHFMATIHDPIVAKSQQQMTYERCEIHQATLEMPITETTIMPATLIGKTRHIRVADCQLTPQGHTPFFEDQTKIWNPAMTSCQGMLGGYIAHTKTNPDHYWVISFWEHQQAHQSYMENTFPKARQQVHLESYIQQIAGYQISVCPNWNVIPELE